MEHLGDKMVIRYTECDQSVSQTGIIKRNTVHTADNSMTPTSVTGPLLRGPVVLCLFGYRSTSNIG